MNIIQVEKLWGKKGKKFVEVNILKHQETSSLKCGKTKTLPMNDTSLSAAFRLQWDTSRNVSAHSRNMYWMQNKFWKIRIKSMHSWILFSDRHNHLRAKWIAYPLSSEKC